MVVEILFFQAEDGIRDLTVTGVQTCALPILLASTSRLLASRRATSAASPTAKGGWSETICSLWRSSAAISQTAASSPPAAKIGRASCRERVQKCVVEG